MTMTKASKNQETIQIYIHIQTALTENNQYICINKPWTKLSCFCTKEKRQTYKPSIIAHIPNQTDEPNIGDFLQSS